MSFRIDDKMDLLIESEGITRFNTTIILQIIKSTFFLSDWRFPRSKKDSIYFEKISQLILKPFSFYISLAFPQMIADGMDALAIFKASC